MNVQEAMSKQVKSVFPETTIRDAAILMRNESVGMLPVLGANNVPVGVVTDRDLAVRAIANGLPETAPVREAMTERPQTIFVDKSIEEAMDLMDTFHIRRVMVCDEKGELRGVLSLGDIASRSPEGGELAHLRSSLAARNKRQADELAFLRD